MEKIVVTGGCGFIGKHLVKRLKQNEKYNVIIYDKCLCYDHDLTSYERIRSFLRVTKPDTIIDLATLPLTLSLKHPYSVAYKIYCMATNLCELLREGYYKKLIHLSSSEVYGAAKSLPMTEYHPMMPQSPYAGAKAAQDMLMISYNRAFQSQICIARPFNTFGPGQDLNAIIPATIKRILAKKQPIIEGNGEQVRDFIYVDDTVEGIIKILEKPEKCYGRIFHLCNGHPIAIGYLVTLICKLMNYKGKIKYTKERPGNVKYLCGSGEFTKYILYFEPEIDLITGLKETIEWWRKQWKNKDFRQLHTQLLEQD